MCHSCGGCSRLIYVPKRLSKQPMCERVQQFNHVAHAALAVQKHWGRIPKWFLNALLAFEWPHLHPWHTAWSLVPRKARVSTANAVSPPLATMRSTYRFDENSRLKVTIYKGSLHCSTTLLFTCCRVLKPRKAAIKLEATPCDHFSNLSSFFLFILVTVAVEVNSLNDQIFTILLF